MEELFYFKQSKFLVAVPIFGSMHYMFWFLLLIKHLIYTLMLDPGFQKVELIGSIKSDEIFKASCLENISWAFFRELLSFVLANILMFLNFIVCIAYCILFLCHAIALIILLYKLLQKKGKLNVKSPTIYSFLSSRSFIGSVRCTVWICVCVCLGGGGCYLWPSGALVLSSYY